MRMELKILRAFLLCCRELKAEDPVKGDHAMVSEAKVAGPEFVDADGVSAEPCSRIVCWCSFKGAFELGARCRRISIRSKSLRLSWQR